MVPASARGFSLIELIIVVTILGVIGAIAIPRLSRGSEGARVNAFIAELNTFANAAERYHIKTGNELADSSTGQLPIELTEDIREQQWTQRTPLGGQWDVEAYDIGGFAQAVGVHYQADSPDLQVLAEVDRLIDDGNLETGNFRNIGVGRYYLILKP